MRNSSLHIKREKNRVLLQGILDIHNFHKAKDIFKAINNVNENITYDLSGITHLDTAGALILHKALKQNIKLENLQSKHQVIIDLVNEIQVIPADIREDINPIKKLVISIGKSVINNGGAIAEFISFLGQACFKFAQSIRYLNRLRFKSVLHYITTAGIEAMPLISIIAFVISIVIAYQAQAQLRPLGVTQYTINLVAISVLREMGALLTAIMVAGRSGSNFTAEIGVMKVNQEIDALRSLGFDSFELLVLPRFIGLLIVLPLLTLLADMIGLFGGALVSLSLIDIGLSEYFERIHTAVTLNDFLVGIMKAPVFALVIALVSCMHGLKVSGSADSVGKETTISVVKSIFIILLLDGLFSIYFDRIGL